MSNVLIGQATARSLVRAVASRPYQRHPSYRVEMCRGKWLTLARYDDFESAREMARRVAPAFRARVLAVDATGRAVKCIPIDNGPPDTFPPAEKAPPVFDIGDPKRDISGPWSVLLGRHGAHLYRRCVYQATYPTAAEALAAVNVSEKRYAK